MEKESAYEIESSVEPIYKNNKAESYIRYIEACNQLVSRYKKEIDFIQDSFEKLREEHTNFICSDLPKMKQILEDEDIPENLVLEWLEEIKNEYSNSFLASERVLADFSSASINQMKGKIRDILNERS